MRLPWQCRLLGHEWRGQDQGAGERVEFCRRCAAERLVLSIAVKFPGQGIARAVYPHGNGQPPVATA